MVTNLIRIWKRKRISRKSTARDTVLNTYELLERILLHLTAWELRKARSVSKAWNNLITRSQPLNVEWQYFEHKYLKLMRFLLIGDSKVGKRTLLRTWHNVVLEHWDPTCGPDDPFRKQVVLDSRKYMYEVDRYSDVGGCHSLFSHYVKNSDCYILVYSATSRESFEHVRGWKRSVEEVAQDRSAAPAINNSTVILGALIETKCDLNEEREVQKGDGERLAVELGCPLYLVSSLSLYDLNRMFEDTGRRCRDELTRQKWRAVGKAPPADSLCAGKETEGIVAGRTECSRWRIISLRNKRSS